MKRLVTFDLETTGLSFTDDRIVQCALVIRSEDGNTTEFNQYFNPGFKMTDEVIAIHGITNEMVADMPPFSEFAEYLNEIFMNPNNILAGFNIMGFDFKMLQAEFSRCGLPFSLVGREVLEMGNLVKILFPRTLEAVFKQEVGKSIQDMFGNVHDALIDTKATDFLFEHMFIKLKREIYETDFIKDELPQIPESASVIDGAAILGKFSRFGNDILDIEGKFKNKDGKIVWGFGKYMGQEVDPKNIDHRGFLQWMIGKDFKIDTFEIVEQFLNQK